LAFNSGATPSAFLAPEASKQFFFPETSGAGPAWRGTPMHHQRTLSCGHGNANSAHGADVDGNFSSPAQVRRVSYELDGATI